MGESIFIVYVEREPQPDVYVSDLSSDGVSVTFDFDQTATAFGGAYSERWQADLHAGKIRGSVAEVPIKSY